jgi:hypothetical protein
VDPFQIAAFQWTEGERRLRDAPPDEQRVLYPVVEQVLAELQRRLGGTFSTDELATLYTNQGTDWASDIAARTAPEHPWAWDPRIVADAAFARYLRQAVDYAGGRRLYEPES